MTPTRNGMPHRSPASGGASFKVLTISREYGSGGGAIARRVADKLGWYLLDQALLDAIARIAQVDPKIVRQYDEHVDVWSKEFHQDGLRSLAVEAGLPPVDLQFFDADTMAEYAQYVIASAASRGNTVIVGRGAPCVLEERPDAFHVFVYAPLAERMARVRRRVEVCEDVEELIRLTDEQRSSYVRKYYGCDWRNPRLYHMMISSLLGVERAASIIVEALVGGGRA